MYPFNKKVSCFSVILCVAIHFPGLKIEVCQVYLLGRRCFRTDAYIGSVGMRCSHVVSAFGPRWCLFVSATEASKDVSEATEKWNST